MDRGSVKARWTTLFKQGLDADGWGQALEASDFYTELSALMDKQQGTLGMDADDLVRLCRNHMQQFYCAYFSPARLF